MLRTVLMAFFSLAVGYIILVVLIDGVLQDSFPVMIISLLMKFGMSQTEADRVYGTVFMQNKGLFVAVGFIILFLIFFYLAMSKVTRYLNSIGTEIETILSKFRGSCDVGAGTEAHFREAQHPENDAETPGVRGRGE